MLTMTFSSCLEKACHVTLNSPLRDGAPTRKPYEGDQDPALDSPTVGWSLPVAVLWLMLTGQGEHLRINGQRPGQVCRWFSNMYFGTVRR